MAEPQDGRPSLSALLDEGDARPSLNALLDERPSLGALMDEHAAGKPSAGDYFDTAVHQTSKGITSAWAAIPEGLAYLTRLGQYLRGEPSHMRDSLADTLSSAAQSVRTSSSTPEGEAAAKRVQDAGGIGKVLASDLPEQAGNLAGMFATAGLGEAAGVAKATTTIPALFGAQMLGQGYEDVQQWSGDEGKALLSGALNAAVGAAGGAVLGPILSKLPPDARMAVGRYLIQATKGAATMAGLSLASDAIAKGLGDPRDREAVKKALEGGLLGALTPAVHGAFEPKPVEPGLAVPEWAKPSGLEPTPPPEAPAGRAIIFQGENPTSFEEGLSRQSEAASQSFVERAFAAGDTPVETLAADVAQKVDPVGAFHRGRDPMVNAQLSEEADALAREAGDESVPRAPSPPPTEVRSPHAEAVDLLENGALADQLKNPLIREHLQTIAAEAGSTKDDSGGRVRDGADRGNFTQSASGIPKSSWWKDRPGNMSEDEIKKLVRRATSDKPGNFTTRQREMLDFLINRTPDAGSPLSPPARRAPPEDMDPMVRAQLEESADAGEPPQPDLRSNVAESPSAREKAIEYLDAKDPAEWHKPEFWYTAPDPMRSAIEQPGVVPEIAKGANVPPESALNARPFRAPEPDAISDIRTAPSDGMREMNQWLADRWLGRFNTDRDALVKEKALDSLGGSKEDGRNLNRAIEFYIDWREYGDEAWKKYLDIEKTRTSDGRKLYPIVEKDRATFTRAMNLPEPVKAMADRVVEENRRLGAMAQEAGLIEDFHDFFTRRIWKSDGTIAGAAKFALNPGALRGRTLESIAHGLALGKELAVEGAVDAQRSARHQVGEAILNRNFIESGLKSGFFVSGETPPGWKTIDHPAFVRRAISAPPELANKLNSVLSSSVLADVGAAKFVDRVAAAYRTSVMSLGYVHHANGIRAALLQGEIASTADLNPRERMRRGLNAIMQGGVHAEGLVRNGLKLGIGPEFDELHRMDRSAFTKKLVEVSQRFPEVERARRWLTEIADERHHFLFNEFFPGLQMYDAQLAVRRAFNRYRGALEDGRMTPDDVYRSIAKTVNDRYGVVNREQTGFGGKAAGTIRHALNWALFAPSWTETRFRQVAKMLVGPEGEKRAYREVMGRTLGRAAMVHLAWDLAMASIHDDTDKNGKDFSRRFIKQVTTDPWKQMTGLRATPLAHALGDTGPESFIGLSSVLTKGLGLIHEPGKAISNVGSVFVHAAADAMSGENARGQPFTNVAELAGQDDKGLYKSSGKGHVAYQEKGGKLAGELASYRAEGKGGITIAQVPSWAASEASEFVPPPLHAALYLLRGQAEGMRLMLNAVGLDIRRSKAQ